MFWFLVFPPELGHVRSKRSCVSIIAYLKLLFLQIITQRESHLKFEWSLYDKLLIKRTWLAYWTGPYRFNFCSQHRILLSFLVIFRVPVCIYNAPDPAALYFFDNETCCRWNIVFLPLIFMKMLFHIICLKLTSKKNK